jgi:hypothetical protein
MTDMPPLFKWVSLAAGSIAHEYGWLNDEKRLKRLTYAMYEAALKCEPTRCHDGYAENSIVTQHVRPRQKVKRDS